MRVKRSQTKMQSPCLGLGKKLLHNLRIQGKVPLEMQSTHNFYTENCIMYLVKMHLGDKGICNIFHIIRIMCFYTTGNILPAHVCIKVEPKYNKKR